VASAARKNNIHFMASDEERDMIRQRMKEAGVINMRAYLLSMAIDGQITHIEIKSIYEMIRLLSNVSNNINQIAKRANETGNVHAADLDEISNQHEAIWVQIKLILNEVSELMGRVSGSKIRPNRKPRRRTQPEA